MKISTNGEINKAPNMSGSQWCSALLGCVATGAAVYILTQDYVQTGQLKPEHILLPTLLLIGTCASKMSMSAWHKGAKLSSVGFAMIGVLATAGVIIKSVGKQAESRDGKVSEIRHNNKRIMTIDSQLASERKRMQSAKDSATWEIAGRPMSRVEDNGRWIRIRDMNGKPTGAKGCGSQCEAWQASADKSEIKISELLEERSKLKAYKTADPEGEHWANVIALFVQVDKRAFAEGLNLLTPINQTLVFELAAMLFFSFALHRTPSHTYTHAHTPAPRPLRTVAEPQQAIDHQPTAALDDALEADNRRKLMVIETFNNEQRKLGKRPTVRHIVDVSGVPRSSVQRYLTDARRTGKLHS